MSGKPFAIATARRTHDAFTLKQPGRSRGFTLAELLVSVFVLSIIILMVAQLMTSATAITRTGHTHISTDTQARAVFDRVAVDFAQMLKRTDMDYFVKGQASYNAHGHGNGHGWGHQLGGQQGSDQIAFFSQVPGYYPASGAQSPISLVAYRVNQNTNAGNPAYLKLERLGKGLLWNGVDNPNQNPNNQNYTSPIVFLPLLISDRWPAAVDGSAADPQSHYETIGPGVFRFEYYYLLKTGKLTDVPWNTDSTAGTAHTSMAGIGLGDVESITVAIAVVDSTGRALIDAASPTSLLDLASDMADFRTSPGRGVGGQQNIGDLEASWQASLLNDISAGQTSNNTPLPPEAAKGIRIYSKTFDLRTL
jgi:prepilin-type N-terminal cleavage/methylation domain-containing protein